MIAGIIGATGYGGAELVRILSGHPQIDGLALASVSYEGDRIDQVYPNFYGKVPIPLEKPEAVIAKAGIVFSALPNCVGEPFAKACMDAGKCFIDLSADFRFDHDGATFEAWYGKPYEYPGLRNQSVYGLPELNRERIQDLAARGPVIIANPGCYPTGASLGAFPALSQRIAGEGTIIVDAASGVSGGGREPSRGFHFPECSDSVAPYKVGAHRHTPEIRRNLAMMTGTTRPGANTQADPNPEALRHVIFTPHLAPMNRGILSTIYIPLAPAWRPQDAAPAGPGLVPPPIVPPSKALLAKAAEIREVYATFYKNEPFVRVLPAGGIAASRGVRLSNYCDISIHLDVAGKTLIVVTAIDNMVKGAAGQAVQNMNILLGYEETAGLTALPAAI